MSPDLRSRRPSTHPKRTAARFPLDAFNSAVDHLAHFFLSTSISSSATRPAATRTARARGQRVEILTATRGFRWRRWPCDGRSGGRRGFGGQDDPTWSWSRLRDGLPLPLSPLLSASSRRRLSSRPSFALLLDAAAAAPDNVVSDYYYVMRTSRTGNAKNDDTKHSIRSCANRRNYLSIQNYRDGVFKSNQIKCV